MRNGDHFNIINKEGNSFEVFDRYSDITEETIKRVLEGIGVKERPNDILDEYYQISSIISRGNDGSDIILRVVILSKILQERGLVTFMYTVVSDLDNTDNISVFLLTTTRERAPRGIDVMEDFEKLNDYYTWEV